MNPAAINRVRTSWLILAVFAISIVVALLFQTVLPAGFGTAGANDYTYYYAPVARSILTGRGLLLPDGQAATANPPGYPLLLAALFRLSTLTGLAEMTLLRMTGLLSMGATSALLFLAARLLWKPWPALLAPLAWMTCPFVLWLTTFPNTELPFVVLLWSAYYLAWRFVLKKGQLLPAALVAGLLVGGAMLVRSIAAGCGVLLAGVAWLAGPKLRFPLRWALALVIVLGSLVVVMPWQLWLNGNTAGFAILGTSAVPSVRDGLTFAVLRKGYRSDIPVPDDVTVLMEDLRARWQGQELDSLGQIGAALADHLREHTQAVLKLLAIKAARSWYGTDSGQWENAILAVQVVYLALVGLASRRAWHQGGVYRRWMLSAWLFALYFWGMTTAVLSIVRYMVPALGLLFLILPGLMLQNSNELNQA